VKLPPSSPHSSENIILDDLWFDEGGPTDENRFGGSPLLSSEDEILPSRRPDDQVSPGSGGGRRRTHYDSGHFRHQGAPIWDPHPQYRFSAFGRAFHLVLSPADDFLSPVLRVTTHERNSTWRDEPGTARVGNKCFYRGFVSGDTDSSVAVSLCHGMVSKS